MVVIYKLCYTINGMKVVFAILAYFAVKSSFLTAKYAKGAKYNFTSFTIDTGQ